MLISYAAVLAVFGTTVLGSSGGLEAKLLAMPEEYVLVNVWSPQCEPCAGEVAELTKALQAVEGSHRLAVLGVPTQGRERAVQDFLTHFRPPYEQWKPDPAFKSRIKTHLGLPWNLLFNKKRALIKEWTGSVRSGELLPFLK